MRIIAGYLGGRTIEDVRGHRTHPMSEKIRGALFNTLGDIVDLTVLDAFAGTGAVSIEAVSRGARCVRAFDNDKDASKTVIKNIHTLQLEKNIEFTAMNVSAWSDDHPDQLFDIVILDPPYDNMMVGLLRKLALHTRSGGVCVLSQPSTFDLALDSFELIAQKEYSGASLAFYRRMSYNIILSSQL
jgi:16S rRNA (guanine966-N2)-methyltransferase